MNSQSRCGVLGEGSTSSYSGINNTDGCDQEVNMNGDDGSRLLAGESKRRLNVEQVKTDRHLVPTSYYINIELGNKLEPDRKMQLARAYGLQPRQIAIWFQHQILGSMVWWKNPISVAMSFDPCYSLFYFFII
ncbi:hypothetical protein L1987_37945 [Smallanthus sonchifolius]|uniref:Uncharacterized protein n=1 Tax=Smallanthus sonchifolius TaxID=185202 RepID=A0ACB9HHA6_9ASTR|nr:hypothetical protein L1987_37945 [Smallanthus sonchifolius]